jgi:hypothetical protein
LSGEIDGWPASDWSNGPGDHYPAHRHSYDKIVLTIAGSITFRLPEVDASFELNTGDRLDLPAGALHGADVGRDGVSCLEARLPMGVLHEVRRHRGWSDAHRDASETITRQGT